MPPATCPSKLSPCKQPHHLHGDSLLGQVAGGKLTFQRSKRLHEESILGKYLPTVRVNMSLDIDLAVDAAIVVLDRELQIIIKNKRRKPKMWTRKWIQRRETWRI